MELGNQRKEVGEEIKIINMKFLGRSFLTLQRGFGVWGFCFFVFVVLVLFWDFVFSLGSL